MAVAHGVVSMFLGVNVYAYVLAHLMSMFRDDHGTRKGFIISNIIIIGALVLVVLLARQISTG